MIKVLDASPDTVHWGYFDAKLKPQLTIESGETVQMSTVSGAPHQMPGKDSAFRVPQTLADIHASLTPKLPGHICTGPIAVRGAAAGDVLEVRIKKIELSYDWGYNMIRPQLGALPDDFPKGRVIHLPLDRARMMATLPWGLKIPLAPFFGVMAVAPPLEWGVLSTIPPRRNGGNIDNKELVAGTTLFLPVHVDGALFSVGDGHAAQGDGEVNVNAIETGLIGTFELHVRKDMALNWPIAESASHVITMGFDNSLDNAAIIALRNMISLISARADLSAEDAYTLCSIAGDLRVTQLVNTAKGIHMMLDKRYLQKIT
jgi:acetamidase/formamidase